MLLLPSYLAADVLLTGYGKGVVVVVQSVLQGVLLMALTLYVGQCGVVGSGSVLAVALLRSAT